MFPRFPVFRHGHEKSTSRGTGLLRCNGSAALCAFSWLLGDRFSRILLLGVHFFTDLGEGIVPQRWGAWWSADSIWCLWIYWPWAERWLRLYVRVCSTVSFTPSDER